MDDDGKVWVDCWNCGGQGFLEDECTCGEDCCCCLEPEPPTCDHCRGNGGYRVPIEEVSAREALR